jgi:hypothetical protein
MNIKDILYENIRLIFEINPFSESWLKRIGSEKKVGHIKPCGYIRVAINGEYYYAHRIVYCLYNHCDLTSNFEVDHIDKNQRNNNPDNLRIASRQLNNLNQRVRKDSLSAIKGVRKLETKDGYCYWVARWKESGKLKEKCFSVFKHGEDEAKKLAIDLRNLKINDSFEESLRVCNQERKGNHE